MRDLAVSRRSARRAPARCSELSEEALTILHTGSRPLRSFPAPAAATRRPNKRWPKPLPVAAGKRSHDCTESRTFPTSAAGFAVRDGASPTIDVPKVAYADVAVRSKTRIRLLAGIGTVS